MVSDYEALHDLPDYSRRALEARRPSGDYFAAIQPAIDSSAASRNLAAVEQNVALLPLEVDCDAVQLRETSGYWRDQWCAPSMTVRMFANRDLKSGTATLWFPRRKNRDAGLVNIRVNKTKVLETAIPRGTVAVVSFHADLQMGQPFNLEIEASLSKSADEQNKRDLAFILKGICFTQSAGAGISQPRARVLGPAVRRTVDRNLNITEK